MAERIERGAGVKVMAEIPVALHERLVLEKLRRRREGNIETTIEGLVIEAIEKFPTPVARKAEA